MNLPVLAARALLRANVMRTILAGTTLLSLLNSAAIVPSYADANPGAHGKSDQKAKVMGNGSGTLLAMSGEGKQIGQCPLQHTSVTAKVSGYVARVTVKQTFQNPFKDKIEAIYTFPLSESGAVDDMIMKVGNRTIHGTIKKKEEARQIYNVAKAAGQVASLLDQERTNIFTQSVANIKPGEKVEITLQYVDLLPYEAGQYRFDFPTVVGPRFIPFNPAKDMAQQLQDAKNISPPVADEGSRAGHDISIDVAIDAGMPIEKVESKVHDVNVLRSGSNVATISLKDKNTIPNKDFVLTWNVASDQLKSGYLAYKEGKDDSGYFTLMILPPKRVTTATTAPKEMIFLIDCSGSQSGLPLDKAKETLTYIIDHMNPQDTFQVVAFNSTQAQLFDKPQPVSEPMKDKAQKWIHELQANGGTWMGPAVEKVCAIPADANRLRIVTFMTDGYVGNDFEILGMIRKLRSKSRWYPFGTGSSVNRMLIDGIAREGGGEAEYVLLNTAATEVGKKFYNRISTPVLTDVKVNFEGLQVKEVFPKEISDVWAEKPLYIKGRYIKPGAGTVTISGFAGGKPYEQKLKLNFPDNSPANAVLGSIWARAKVDRLMSEDYFGAQSGSVNKELKEEIIKTALDHHIMTQYTSFVAVEDKPGTTGGEARTVQVPVEMPEGVSREGVFGYGGGAPGGGGGGGSFAPVRGKVMAMHGYSMGKGNVGSGARFQYAPNQWNAPALQGATNGTIGAQSAPSALPPPPTEVTASAGKPAAPLPQRSRPENELAAADALKSVAEPRRAAHQSEERAQKRDGDENAESKKELSKQELSKLDSTLVGLAAKVAAGEKVSGIELHNGKVTIEVTLDSLSEATLKRLKACGLEILIQTQASKTVIGRIDVEKLEDLCQLEFVSSIKPAKKK